MRLTHSLPILCLLVSAPLAADDGPITYRTHIRKIFRDHCASCHNRNRARAGLDLTTYGGAIQGSSSGRILMKGDAQDSVLYLCMTHQEQPAMPPGKNPLDQKILEAVRVWIELGLPEQPGDIKPQPDPATASMDAVEPPNEPASSRSGESAADATAESTETSATAPNAGLSLSPVYQGPQTTAVTATSVSPDGRWAAIGGQLQVLVYDLQSRSLAGVLPFPEGEAFVLRFNADGRLLLAGGGIHSESGRVVVWDLNSGQRIRELGDEYDVVLAADLSPDGSTVLLGGPERIVKVIDMTTLQPRATLTKHTDWVLTASFSPEGLIFATSDRAGNVYVWETGTAASLHTLRGHRGAVPDICWTKDGNQCITAGEDGTVRFWDMHTGKPIRQWSAHKDGVLSATMATSGQLLTTGRDDSLKVWTAEGTLVKEIDLGSTPLHVEAADENHALTGDWRGQVTLWDLSSGEEVGPLAVNQQLLTADLSKIDQSVVSPEMPVIARGDAVSGPESTADPSSSDAMHTEVAAQLAMQAQESLRQAVEQLPTALAEMHLAENSVLEAQETLARVEASVESNSGPAGVVNRLKTVQDALATARQMIEAVDSPSDEERQIAVLTALALEKANARLSMVEDQSPLSRTAARGDSGSSVDPLRPELIEASISELRRTQANLQTALDSWTSARAELMRLRETIRASTAELDQSVKRWDEMESTMRSTLQTAGELESRVRAARNGELATSTTKSAGTLE